MYKIYIYIYIQVDIRMYIHILINRILGKDFIKWSRSLRVHAIVVSSEFVRHSSCYAIIYVCTYATVISHPSRAKKEE